MNKSQKFVWCVGMALTLVLLAIGAYHVNHHEWDVNQQNVVPVSVAPSANAAASKDDPVYDPANWRVAIYPVDDQWAARMVVYTAPGQQPAIAFTGWDLTKAAKKAAEKATNKPVDKPVDKPIDKPVPIEKVVDPTKPLVKTDFPPVTEIVTKH